MKQITVPVTTTITETKTIELPAFFQHSDYCFIAYFDKDKAIEVNVWPKTVQIGLCSQSIDFLAASNGYYLPITKEEFYTAYTKSCEISSNMRDNLATFKAEAEHS